MPFKRIGSRALTLVRVREEPHPASSMRIEAPHPHTGCPFDSYRHVNIYILLSPIPQVLLKLPYNLLEMRNEQLAEPHSKRILLMHRTEIQSCNFDRHPEFVVGGRGNENTV